MNIQNLGYVLLDATDVTGWRDFGTRLLGAMDSAATDNVVALKIDEHPFRVRIDASVSDRLAAIGWEMGSSEDLAAMHAHLAASGVAVREGTPDEAALRCVTTFFAATDPAGNPIEFYYGRTGCGEAFQSPAGVSAFVTGDMGLGHIVVSAASAFDETHDFYTLLLGLGDSDDLTIAPPVEDMPEMRVRFMHAANPRHHSLALFNLPTPTGVVHLMFEMTALDDVGRCYDRVQAGGLSLMATLGRHCNDNMLSFYVNGPGRIPVEVGCEGLQLDWSQHEPTVSTVPDHWGHTYQLNA